MSAGQADYVEAGLTVIQITTALSSGQPAEALKHARQLVDQIILMVPVDELKSDLTPNDRTFGDLAADVAEQIKVGSSSGG